MHSKPPAIFFAVISLRQEWLKVINERLISFAAEEFFCFLTKIGISFMA